MVQDGGNIFFGTKRSNQWMLWTQWDIGIRWWKHCLWCKKGQTNGSSRYSEIVAYDSGDIVFGQTSGHSGIVVYDGGNIVFGAKKVKPIDAVDAVE